VGCRHMVRVDPSQPCRKPNSGRPPIILVAIPTEGARGSRKVARSNPDEVDFLIDLILPAAIWLWARLSL
jgi:hypothetical protein